MAMRGIVDVPELVDLNGENPTRVRRWAWIIGTVFATVAGLLISPSLGLDATVITLLVVQAFGAAAIGYFSSLPLTFIGGLVIGLLASFGAEYSVDVSWLSGLPGGIPFIVLFLVLIFMPARKLADRRPRHALPVPRSWNAPPRVRLLAGALTLIAFVVIPPLAGLNLSAWTTAVIDIPLFLSVGLLARTAGQISLCQYTFCCDRRCRLRPLRRRMAHPVAPRRTSGGPRRAACRCARRDSGHPTFRGVSRRRNSRIGHFRG